MTKQRHFSGGWIVGLALVVLLGAAGLGQDARAAGAYNVSLRAPDAVPQFQSAELVAVVTDSQGNPVSGVPVNFRVASGWEKDITLSPQSPVTRNGEARTIFRSDMPGVVYMTAQVGDTTQPIHITVIGGASRPGDTLNAPK